MPQNSEMLNEKQLQIVAEAGKLGIVVKWWGRPEEPLSRLYVNNNIQIGDTSAQVKIYYKFENPETLANAEMKVSTMDTLDKNVYKELMKGVRSWLKPLSDLLQVPDFVYGKPNVVIPTVPRKGHTVGEIDDPKYTSTERQFPPASEDDIPF